MKGAYKQIAIVKLRNCKMCVKMLNKNATLQQVNTFIETIGQKTASGCCCWLAALVNDWF